MKKGERVIAIIAPLVLRNRNAATGEDETQLRFRAVHVFDIAQTEGEPLPEFARVGGDPGPHLERLEGVIRELGITLEIDTYLGGADGASFGGRIVLREGLSPAEHFSILVHELAHERLHHRLAHEERPPKLVRETEAESVAFVVTRAIGLETGSAASDYIQLYQGSPETLAASLHRIQRVASEILAGLHEAEAPACAA